jgi:S1-C subfamily serine protease
MGKEIKFADGKISSKTGFNGDINSYQSTIPVQPGNSGSPVFNEKGEVVGMINAKYKDADNVSYIVKTPLLQNVLTLSNDNIKLSEKNTIATNSVQNKIKKLSKNIVIIKVK